MDLHTWQNKKSVYKYLEKMKNITFSSSKESFGDIKERLIIHLSNKMQILLEEDFKRIKFHNKLVKLPCSPNILQILEHYFKMRAAEKLFKLTANPKRKFHYKSKNKKLQDLDSAIQFLHICKEVMDGIRISFDFTLPDLLLYCLERKQYNHLKIFQEDSDNSSRCQNEENLENLITSETNCNYDVSSSTLLPVMNIKKELEQEEEDKAISEIVFPCLDEENVGFDGVSSEGQKLLVTSENNLIHGTEDVGIGGVSSEGQKPIITSENNVVYVAEEFGISGISPEDKNPVVTSENNMMCRVEDVDPNAARNPDVAVEKYSKSEPKVAVKTEKEDRSQELSFIKNENTVLNHVEEQGDDRISPFLFSMDGKKYRNQRNRSLRPRYLAAKISRITTRSMTSNSRPQRTVETDRVKAIFSKIMETPIVPPNQKLMLPSSVYGAIHLARLFVKLPEVLQVSAVPYRKLLVLSQHLHLFLSYLEGHPEWFGEEQYRDNNARSETPDSSTSFKGFQSSTDESDSIL